MKPLKHLSDVELRENFGTCDIRMELLDEITEMNDLDDITLQQKLLEYQKEFVIANSVEIVFENEDGFLFKSQNNYVFLKNSASFSHILEEFRAKKQYMRPFEGDLKPIKSYSEIADIPQGESQITPEQEKYYAKFVGELTYRLKFFPESTISSWIKDHYPDIYFGGLK